MCGLFIQIIILISKSNAFREGYKPLRKGYCSSSLSNSLGSLLTGAEELLRTADTATIAPKIIKNIIYSVSYDLSIAHP